MEKDPTISKLLETLKKNPADLETFRNLEQYCLYSSEWEYLAVVYGLRAQAIEKGSSEESAQLYFKQGDCLEKRLANKKDALEAYERAYRLSPENKEYFETLIATGEGLQNWQKVLDILQDKASRTKNKSAKSALWIKMALCYQNRLQNLEQAKALLQQTLKLDEQNAEVPELLEKIYLSEEAWEPLLDLYQMSHGRSSSTQDKILRLRQCAQICEKKLQYLPKAISFYEDILKLSPNDMPTLSSLESLYSTTEHWEQLVVVMENQLKLTKSDDEKVKVLTRVALVWSDKLKNLVNAVRCYEKALEIKEDKMILEILEETYSFQKDWNNLARIYKKQANIAANSKEKVTIYCRLAELMEEKLKQVDEAIAWYQKAFAEAPNDVSILKKLQKLYEAKKDVKNLLDSYRKELPFATEKRAKLEIFDNMANLLMQNGRKEDAGSVYEEVLLAYPEERRIFACLRELYQQLNLPEKLTQTMAREAELLSPKEKIPLYMQIASLLKEKVKQEEKAVEYYKKILEIEPKSLDVLQILKEYYARQSVYPSLIATIQKIMQVSPSQTLPGHLEIASIQRDKLKDLKSAIESYHKVLEIAPHYVDAWKALREMHQERQEWDDYIRVSEKLLGLIANVVEKIAIRYSLADAYLKEMDTNNMERHLDEIVQMSLAESKAIERLKGFYTEQRIWDKLVVLLEKETLVFAGNFQVLSQKYQQIGNLYDQKIKQPEKAIFYYEKANLCNPGNPEILKQLERLYEENKNYARLAEILEDEARISDVAQAVQYRCREAVLYEQEVKDIPKALKTYNRLLLDAPDHWEAMMRMENLFIENKEFAKLAELYNQQAQLPQEKEKLISLHKKAIRMSEESMEDSAYAISHCRAILRLKENDAEAIEKLLSLYRLEQLWQEIVEIYDYKLKIAADKDDTISILHDQASVFQHQMNWLSRARECYQKILELDSGNLKAIMALEEICQKEEQWHTLCETLEKKLKISQNPKVRKEILSSLGEIWHQKLQEHDTAIAYYEQVAELDANDQNIWNILYELYKSTSMHEKNASVIEKKLKFSSDEKDKIRLLFEIAEISENHLHKIKEAKEYLERILTIEPDNHNAFEILTRIHKQTGNKDALLELWERQVYVTNSENQKTILLNMAFLLEEKGNQDRAVQILEQAYELDPKYEPVQECLASLYHKLQNWGKLLELYKKQLETQNEPQKKAWIYHHIGQLEEKLQNPDAALEMYKKAIELEPNNIPVIQHIEDIYCQKGKLLELVAACKQELAIPQLDTERRIALLLKSAEILEFKLDNCDGAKENYLSALDMDTKNLIAIRGLQRIYQKNKEYKALHGMFQKELELQSDPARQCQIYIEIGTLHEEKFVDLASAAQYFQKVHEKRPEDVWVIGRLQSLWKQQENWLAYTQMCEKKIALLESKESMLELRRELMNLYETKLNDIAKAIGHGQEILKSNPTHLDTVLQLEKLYAKAGDKTCLVSIYTKEIELIASQGPQDRLITLYLEAGKIYQELQQGEKAVECFQKIIELEPSHSEALSCTATILNQAKKWKELIAIYEVAASLSKNKGEIEKLHLQIGAIYEQELADPQEALVHYQIAYRLNPQNATAVRGARELLEKLERWGEAISMMEVEAGFLDEKRKPRLYLAIADTWSDKLAMHHQALGSYLRVMEYGFHRPTVEKMMKIYEKLGDYEGMSAILEKDIRMTDLKSEELMPKLIQLGDIYWKELHKTEEALRVFNAAIKLDKQHPHALDMLEEIMERTEDWQSLTTVVRQKLHNTEVPQLRFNISNKLAKVFQERLHLGNYAIHYYEKCLGIFPSHLSTIHTLEKVYEEWGQFQKLVALYQKELEMLSKMEGTTEESQEAKAKPESKAKPEPKAKQKSQASQEKPESQDDQEKPESQDDQAKPESQDDQAKPESQNTKPEQDGQSKSESSNASPEDADIVLMKDAKARRERIIALYHAIGAIWDKKLFDNQEAIQTYNKLTKFAPEDMDAARCLASLYRRCEQWENLTAVLQSLIKDAQDRSELNTEVKLQMEMGRLCEQLNQRQNAIASFQRVLELEEFHDEAFRSLEKLYEQENSFLNLVETLEDKAKLVTKPKESVEIQLRLAKLYEEEVKKQDKAIESLRKVLTIDTNNLVALKSLHRLYQAQNDGNSLAEIAQKELELAEKPEEKASLCFLLGTLYLEYFEKPDQAKRYFLDGIQQVPSHTASLMQLCEIAEKEQKWEEMAGYMAQAIEHVKKPEEKATLLTKLGTLYRDKLQQTPKAMEMYEASLQIVPESMETIESLAEIYFESALWKQLEPLMERLISLLDPKATEKLAICYYRWGCSAQALGEINEAISRYLSTLQVDENHLPALLALAEIFYAKGQWPQLSQVCTKAYSLETLQDKREVLYKLGVAEEKLHHSEKAIEYYEKLLAITPDRWEAVDSLVKLHKEVKNFQQSIVYCQQMISNSGTEEKRQAYLKEKAYLLSQIGEVEDAIEIYGKVFDYNPQDASIPQALVGLYMEIQKWEQAEHWNDQHFRLLTTTKDKVENRCLYGRILFEGMKKSEEAVAVYRKVLEIDPVCLKAIQEIETIYKTEKKWHALAENYQKFLEGLPADKKKVGFTVHISLGHLFADKLNNVPNAIKEFEKALELEPDHLETQIALTELKTATPDQKDEAIKGHLLLLRRDQFRIASYRALIGLMQQSDPDRAMRAYRALVIADAKEKQNNPFGEKAASKKVNQVSPSDITQYVVPSRISILHELMSSTGEFQEKAYPVDLLKKYGINRKAHLGADKVQRPVWYYAHTIMKTLGIQEMYMYINPQATNKIYLENTEPPSIIISQSLIDQLTEPELRFVLTKYMFYISQKQVLAHKLTPEELEVYFHILRTCFVPPTETLTPEADALQRKMKAGFPRKQKQLLDTRTDLWEGMSKMSVKQYLICLDYSSNRLSLLLSDSLELSVKMVYSLSKLEKGEIIHAQKMPTIQEMNQVDQIADLFLYNMTEQYGKIRKICGLSIEQV